MQNSIKAMLCREGAGTSCLWRSAVPFPLPFPLQCPVAFLMQPWFYGSFANYQTVHWLSPQLTGGVLPAMLGVPLPHHGPPSGETSNGYIIPAVSLYRAPKVGMTNRIVQVGGVEVQVEASDATYAFALQTILKHAYLAKVKIN